MFLDDKKFSCGIFIELQKALNTVDYNGHIPELKQYYIRGIVNNWCKTYSHNKTQCVSLNGILNQTPIYREYHKELG